MEIAQHSAGNQKSVLSHFRPEVEIEHYSTETSNWRVMYDQCLMTLLSGVTILLFGSLGLFHVFFFISGLMSLVFATARIVTFITSCVCIFVCMYLWCVCVWILQQNDQSVAMD